MICTTDSGLAVHMHIIADGICLDDVKLALSDFAPRHLLIMCNPIQLDKFCTRVAVFLSLDKSSASK